MEKNFDASSSEARWYAAWWELGYFKPKSDLGGSDSSIPVPSDPSLGQRYSITIPPPNVTGSLHMGHALCYTIHDILGRWRRMSGDDVLILPGVDHAGIATQNVVERELAQEGMTRHDLGRERFVERVWTWKERFGARIIQQLQRLGCAFDWSRERFTMDDDYVDAILEEFIRLFDQGLIYRGARVINWCPRCQTALSDIEVEYEERDTFLWHIRYPFADGDGSLTVATTRPETMLGDTAVAVNPGDPRYAGMRGRTLLLPLADRAIPLIFDDYASIEFGTGAVKVTPAHDLNDFEAGRRNKLPQIVVIGEDGRMTSAAGDKYAGLTREEAREAVERDLESQGFLVKKEPYHHAVGTCERCHTIIEPLLSEQWFVKMSGSMLVEKAMDVVRRDEITFAPDRYKRVYLDWMENIRDWCISRQLWWGHRIPIYYAPDGTYVAAKTAQEAATKLGLRSTASGSGASPEIEGSDAFPDQAASGELHVRQDEDVLDTWFSSALWPFATMGWPRETSDLARFYPTNVLITSREIIYLWVARMIMTGVEFMDGIPFQEVYIYATVLDKLGRRMSKSLGNGIDPVEMIEQYGADALRFSLVRLASKGQDIKFSEDRIPESRNFCTKIWNAARFVLMNLETYPAVSSPEDPQQLRGVPTSPIVGDRNKWFGESGVGFSIPERWILTRLQQTAAKVNAAFSSYDMDDACSALYEFFWNDYCDWFVELAKPALRSDNVVEKQRMQWVLWHVLESALRLMHPIMPFLTEEIWQELPHEGETIMYAPFPIADGSLVDNAAASQMETIIAAIRTIRNARGELKIAPSAALDISIVADPANRALIEANAGMLMSLARLNQPEFVETAPSGHGIVALPIRSGLDFFLPLTGAVDVGKERARIKSEIAGVDKDIAINENKLANPQFVAKAAPAVVAKARALLAELTEKKAKLEEQLAALGPEAA